MLSAQIRDVDQVADALTALRKARIGVSEFSVGSPSLDEVFLALTGRPAEDAATEAEA
jgi:ABC-2 type transport system ATP-binding protein